MAKSSPFYAFSWGGLDVVRLRPAALSASRGTVVPVSWHPEKPSDRLAVWSVRRQFVRPQP